MSEKSVGYSSNKDRILPNIPEPFFRLDRAGACLAVDPFVAMRFLAAGFLVAGFLVDRLAVNMGFSMLKIDLNVPSSLTS